jgi:hypothetical protein
VSIEGADSSGEESCRPNRGLPESSKGSASRMRQATGSAGCLLSLYNYCRSLCLLIVDSSQLWPASHQLSSRQVRVVWCNSRTPQEAVRPRQFPPVSRRSHQCSIGRSGHRLCDANGRRKELDLPIASHSRQDRLDSGHQSASGVDLGSSESLEGFGSGVCGEWLRLTGADDRC